MLKLALSVPTNEVVTARLCSQVDVEVLLCQIHAHTYIYERTNKNFKEKRTHHKKGKEKWNDESESIINAKAAEERRTCSLIS